jgi:type I restriction enzyme M protein
LPLNVFYGAGVPACLLILRKDRPPDRHDKVLLVYAARHFRELSNQNELRPQDVMRILVHFHAYGDPSKVPDLVAEHGGRLREQINQRELEEVERLEVEYKEHHDRLARIDTEIAELRAEETCEAGKAEKVRIEKKVVKLESQRENLSTKIAERDERITECRRRAEEDRKALADVGRELGTLYGDPDELLKHSRVVSLAEVEENDFNLNIPRYVDTFDPEPRIEVNDALQQLTSAKVTLADAERSLFTLLKEAGYEAK